MNFMSPFQVLVLPVEEPSGVGVVPIPLAKPIGSFLTALCLVTIGLNAYVCYMVYKKRGLRASSTAIIIANLACVDVLVTLKDLPMFLAVSSSGRWYFEEAWCATYGLTNVIYIIVSVSTLVTITTERYCQLRDMARDDVRDITNEISSRPVLLGYVIAHTTLSYSLSLLWRKYTFISRKAFCRLEWPPRQGWSLTFITSFIFIIPVSLLIYNILYRSFVDGSESKLVKQRTENVEEDLPNADIWEIKAHMQLEGSVALFLLSWAPYVIESMVSGYMDISPNIGIFTACVPLLSTSLMPILYIKFLREEPRNKDCNKAIVIVQ